MRSALPTLALLPLIAATTPATIVRPKPCAHPGVERIDTRRPVRAKKLNEMPPAQQMLGVYRSIGGCPTPAVLRERVGDTPPPLPPA